MSPWMHMLPHLNCIIECSNILWISDNVQQFARKWYQNPCRMFVILNTFTSTYHPHKNGQVERLNHSIAAMLPYFGSDHPENFDE